MYRQAFGDNVEGLPVDRVDRHLRRAEKARIIEGADFQHNRFQARPPGDNVSATCLAEFARHSAVQIATLELSWRPFGVPESLGRHQHEHVGSATADVLTLSAMTLRS